MFIEGVIFIALSNFGIREKIFDSIPLSLKHGVSVGLGIFDTLGTLIGVGSRAEMLDENGRLPQIRPHMYVLAILFILKFIFL